MLVSDSDGQVWAIGSGFGAFAIEIRPPAFGLAVGLERTGVEGAGSNGTLWRVLQGIQVDDLEDWQGEFGDCGTFGC